MDALIRQSACLLVLCLLHIAPGARGDQAFLEALRVHRDNVDFIFRDRILSPLPETDRLVFQGLAYYPPDRALRLAARLVPATDTAVFAMPTFDRETISYRRVGTVQFELNGEVQNLQGFRRPSDAGVRQVLLIPFTDPTNREETYPGGRYLELDLPLPDPMVIDFNRAMNPWCAYDSSYACPIPPRSNRLDIPVRAGEKRYR